MKWSLNTFHQRIGILTTLSQNSSLHKTRFIWKFNSNLIFMNVIVYFSHKLGHNDSTIVNTFSINILHFKLMPLNQSWKKRIIIQNVPNIYHMYPLKKYLYLLHWCCFFVHNLIMSRTIQLCLSGIDFWFLAISNSKWFSVLRFMFYEKKPLPIPSPFHTHFNKQLFPILDDAKYILVNV